MTIAMALAFLLEMRLLNRAPIPAPNAPPPAAKSIEIRSIFVSFSTGIGFNGCDHSETGPMFGREYIEVQSTRRPSGNNQSR
jgi:hypothetical protein